MGGDDLQAEASALKQKIRDARKAACDTQMVNETASIDQLKIALRIRKTLRGHLSKVCTGYVTLFVSHVLVSYFYFRREQFPLLQGGMLK